jgi:diguanylate cyclase (GGDEF)-like protein
MGKKFSINSFILSQLAVKSTKVLYRYKDPKNALYHLMKYIFKYFSDNFEEISLYLYKEEKKVLKEEIRINSSGIFNGRDNIPIYQLPKELTRDLKIISREIQGIRDVIIPFAVDKKPLGMIEMICRPHFTPPKVFLQDLKVFQEILSQGLQYLETKIRTIEISEVLVKISNINKKLISLIETQNMEKRLIKLILDELGFDRVMIYFIEEGLKKKASLLVGVFGKGRIFKYSVSLENIINYINKKTIPLIHFPIVFDGMQKGGIIVDNFLTLTPFSREIEDFFGELTSELSLLFENTYLFRNIKHDAIFDHLTGLYRPKHFYEIIDKNLKELKKAAVISLDFDNFKEVNDTYGHLVGDRALEIAGKIIRKNLRATDFACRMGGDEFLVFLPNADEEKAKKIAERIILHFQSNPLNIEGFSIRLSLSCGIAIFPKDGNEKEALLSASDRALYLSKNKGKGVASFAGELGKYSDKN